jgi:hypothetical protein
MAHIKTTRCPLCGSLPYIILAGGAQAFCPGDDCPIILWDMLATLDQNLEGLADELIELARRQEPDGPPATS